MIKFTQISSKLEYSSVGLCWCTPESRYSQVDAYPSFGQG